ncbi:MAG: TVP38/TMEM64 family protein [Gemmataceae bacterium]|nr:TVP38/TMEM64 family protein [Gemmataceae bacterium]
MNQRSLLRLFILALLVAAFVLSLVFLPELKDRLEQFLDWAREIGPWGPVVVATVYVPAAVFLFPGSVLTLGAGFLFGPVVGTVAVSAGSVGGAAAAFFAGRFLARDWIEQRVAANPRFRAIDQAVAEQGFKIVLLTRLAPIFPYNLLNYAYGLTRVRFRDYLLASWLGMLPGTIMYVYLGSLVQNLAELFAGKRERTVGEQVLFYGGLVVAVVGAVYVTRIAKKALDKAIGETDNPRPTMSKGNDV